MLLFVVIDLENVQSGRMSTQQTTDNSRESMPRTARDRARAEVTKEITVAARAQLATGGASALSLRAVARAVGMVSSAVYRYFPSRDDLLTALIVDAYIAVGEAATTADAAVQRTKPMRRWLAVSDAVRRWARASPHEYGLIFGTPVPGYRAPADTIDPAVTVPLILLDILVVSERNGSSVGWSGRPIPASMRRDLGGVRASLGPLNDEAAALGDAALAQGLMAWTQLIGAISFEMFGHLHNVIHDHDAYFTHQMRNIGLDLGLTA